MLDLSVSALEATRRRLAADAPVRLVEADVPEWEPDQRYDLWHDRAAFHFLVAASDRDTYLATLQRAVAEGGSVIVGTFAEDGPEICSGLPPDDLHPEVGKRASEGADPAAGELGELVPRDVVEWLWVPLVHDFLNQAANELLARFRPAIALTGRGKWREERQLDAFGWPDAHVAVTPGSFDGSSDLCVLDEPAGSRLGIGRLEGKANAAASFPSLLYEVDVLGLALVHDLERSASDRQDDAGAARLVPLEDDRQPEGVAVHSDGEFVIAHRE